MKRIIHLMVSAGMVFSLTSCSSNAMSNGSNKAEDSENGSAASDSMHFELEGGTLDYVGYEYVSPGFYYEGGDYTKTICFNFDYTNNEDNAKRWSDDFWITAYQNGNELEKASGYTTDSETDTMKNSMETVLKGGTLHFGIAYVLQDYSPVTFIANHNGGKETSGQTVIEIEPYQDNSFDIDRLYGIWKADGATLTLTSSRITVDKGSSSTYKDDPQLWTDETTLHTPLFDYKELAIEEIDGTLHLICDEYDFVQEENWSEASGSGGELTEAALNEPIVTDFAELIFDEQDTADEIIFTYTSSGGGITIKNIVEQQQDNTKYVYVKGTIKNTSSNSYNPENMKAKFVVDGKYELEGKVNAYDGNGSNTLDLEPLNTKIIYVDTGLDNAVAEAAESIDLYIGFERSFSGNDDGDPEGSTYYYLIKLK